MNWKLSSDPSSLELKTKPYKQQIQEVEKIEEIVALNWVHRAMEF